MVEDEDQRGLNEVDEDVADPALSKYAMKATNSIVYSSSSDSDVGETFKLKELRKLYGSQNIGKKKKMLAVSTTNGYEYGKETGKSVKRQMGHSPTDEMNTPFSVEITRKEAMKMKRR